MKEIKEIKYFLWHIQPRIGESAFDQIWETVEILENRLKKPDPLCSCGGRALETAKGSICYDCEKTK